MSATPTQHAALLQRFTPDILALPERAIYGKADLWSEDSPFLLDRSGRISIYFAPFGHVNPAARIAIVGITSGFDQAERAFRVARRALRAGLPAEAIFREVTRTAAFAGSMRANLVTMLDQLGLPDALGIPSSLTLFGDRVDLLHATSAVRYPVVIDGHKNYNGSTPRLSSHPTLRAYLREYLAYELSQCPRALVVPLGDRVGEALQDLAAQGLLDPGRLLLGFPHPSGANGHRLKHFHGRREDLGQRIRQWFDETSTSK